MTKYLTVLMCVLILTGFGALATADPASSIPSAPPSQAVVAPAPVAQLFLEACGLHEPRGLLADPLQHSGARAQTDGRLPGRGGWPV